MSGRMVAPRAGTTDNSFRPKRREGLQMTKVDTGVCEVCRQSFNYLLIHNGFGDTAYAYCDKCGRTAFVSGWSKNIPVAAKLKLHGPVNPEAEALLAPCSCGGAFRAGATPRCPHCRSPLSAELATVYLEANAPGTAKGWRWQRSWQGLYAIVIDGNSTKDPWRLDG